MEIHVDDVRRRVPIEETEIFQLFESFATWAWDRVAGWDSKAQMTIGTQLVRAADSINANLVEGDGRYSSADSLHFFVIARASAREARLWVDRAIRRGLIDPDDGLPQLESIDSASKQLNRLIAFRRKNRPALMVHETTALWDTEVEE